MYIDTHAHIFDEKIDKPFILDKNIQAVIVPSYNKDNLQKALTFCEYDKYFCCLGIHPQYADEFSKNIENFIINHIDKLVAIGEIGLDTRFNNFEKQIETFGKQSEIAKVFDLPISLHLLGNNAFTTFFDMTKNKNYKVAMHCFSGSLQDAKKALDNGYYISFACNITYKGNVNLRKIVDYVPLNNILLETDSPSMLPAIFARKGVNTPNNIHYVAEKIAEIKHIDIEKVQDVTTQNAISLFNLNRSTNN